MKKILSLMLTVAVLLLSSCGGADVKTEATTDILGAGSCILYPPTTSPIKTLDDGTAVHSAYENVDFGGRVFYIESEFDFADWDIYEITGNDETKAEPLSRAVAERNEKIETLYNCKIERVAHTTLSSSLELPSAVCVFSSDAYSRGNGNYYNLATLGMNFSNPWWDRAYIDEMTVDGYLYSLVGSFSLSAYDATRVLYFNKDIWESTPALADTDVYSLVKNGEWTADEFVRIMRVCESDSVCGIVGSDAAITSFYFGAGGDYLQKLDDIAGNTNAYAFGKASEDAFEAVKKIFSSSGTQILDGVSSAELFKEGKTLFVSGNISHMQDFSGGRFGVLPYPAYSGEQISTEGYKSIVDGGFYYVSVPKSVNFDLALVSDFLELYAFHSQYIVFPEYENVLKYTLLEDDGDRDMLGIILGGRTYDIARYHNFCDAEKYVADGVKTGADITKNWNDDKGSSLEEALRAYKNYLRENM